MKFETSSFGTAHIKTASYPDGNFAVFLVDDSGAPLTKLSVNIPESAHLLDENQFFAKTYSENEEIAQEALQSGFFVQTNTVVKNGWVTCPIWKILQQ